MSLLLYHYPSFNLNVAFGISYKHTHKIGKFLHLFCFSAVCILTRVYAYFRFLIFNTLIFLINIFTPYSFETVFYLFIIACRAPRLLDIIACHLNRSSLVHPSSSGLILPCLTICNLVTLLTRLQLQKAGSVYVKL